MKTSIGLKLSIKGSLLSQIEQVDKTYVSMYTWEPEHYLNPDRYARSLTFMSMFNHCFHRGNEKQIFRPTVNRAMLYIVDGWLMLILGSS